MKMGCYHEQEKDTLVHLVLRMWAIKERDSELAIIAQSIQLVSDRVDSVSEQLESVRNDVSSLNQAATLLAKRQRLLSWIVWALLVILAAVVLVSAVTWNRWWVLIRVHH